MPHLFFEKSVDSFAKLMQEADLLDIDSGIRTYGDYKGKKGQFVFVTKSPYDGYTLMIYDKKSIDGTAVPTKRLLVKEFKGKDDLGKFMKRLLSKPVRAFVY